MTHSPDEFFDVVNQEILKDDLYKMDKSRIGKLSETDWKKIGKGAVLAMGGALGVYALSALPQISIEDFGIYAPVASAIISVLLNVLRKYFAGE